MPFDLCRSVPADKSALVQRVKANRKGRDFAVGDLHGMLDAFLEALDRVAFNSTVDRIFSVGDLIDRGPRCFETLKLVEQPWFYAVRGNHEQMMLDATTAQGFVFWQSNGGNWILGEEGENWIKAYALASALPFAIMIERVEVPLKADPIVISHSDLPVTDGLLLEESLQDDANCKRILWSRKGVLSDSNVRVKNIHAAIHGHSPISAVKRLGTAIYIDTGCVYGGPLTLLDLARV